MCLFGRERQQQPDLQWRCRIKAISFCIGLTRTSTTGLFPTLTLTICRLLSSSSKYKRRIIDGPVAAVYDRRSRNLKIKEGCFPKRPLSAVWRPSGLFPLQEDVSRRRPPLHGQTPTLSQESLFCPTSTIGTGIFAEQNGMDS